MVKHNIILIVSSSVKVLQILAINEIRHISMAYENQEQSEEDEL